MIDWIEWLTDWLTCTTAINCQILKHTFLYNLSHRQTPVIIKPESIGFIKYHFLTSNIPSEQITLVCEPTQTARLSALLMLGADYGLTRNIINSSFLIEDDDI